MGQDVGARPYVRGFAAVFERERPILTVIGRNAQRLREAKNISREDAAKAIGVTPRQIAILECGEALWTPGQLLALAARYGCSVGALMKDAPSIYDGAKTKKEG